LALIISISFNDVSELIIAITIHSLSSSVRVFTDVIICLLRIYYDDFIRYYSNQNNQLSKYTIEKELSVRHYVPTIICSILIALLF
jgi:hypothetical protein